jgi:VCBS repeat-containing protein
MSDGSLTDQAVLTITIGGANDAPVAVNDPGSATEKGGTAGTLGSGLAGAHGTLMLNADGGYTYLVNETDAAVQALNAGGKLTDAFNYTMSDGSLTDQAVLTITIAGTNDGPTISDVADIGFTEDANASAQDLSACGTVSFDDIDANDVVDISTALTTGAVWSGGTIKPELKALLEAGFTAGATDAAAPGCTPWSYSVDNAALDFLAAGETITLTYTLTATDSANATATDTVTITIAGTNDGPTLCPVARVTFHDTHKKGDTFDPVTGTLTTTDPDQNDTATYSITGGAADNSRPDYDTSKGGAYGTLYLDSATGDYTYVPNSAAIDKLDEHDKKTVSYDVAVTDDYGATATTTLRFKFEGEDEKHKGDHDHNDHPDNGIGNVNGLIGALFFSPSSGSLPTSDTYTGVGSAVDVVDFSTAAFTTFAFGAETPIDPTYAIDILSHFDGGSHQIDLSGIFDKSAGAGAVNADNIDDYVQFDDQGGGKVNLPVDPDGAGGSSAAIKIAEISGTAGPDHHALGSSASDVIAVVVDPAQPPANVAVAHAR